MNNVWHRGTVLQGDKTGRILGYPTVNINPNIILPGFKNGVYSCKVNVLGMLYDGALFYGPRLVKNETNRVLEIHIIGFTGNLYDKKITFQIGEFIRDNIKFKSLEDLRLQIQKDILKIVSSCKSH
ncbi:hypothetical protein COY90_02470 [Candidatus Roizmanbacteria bacterium CG_4_10_14_0_8_um_filter_39_9]|uniref:riboflavin kinase n=1 Tax=Candidatus Roizmanbacteria bacterium CG_4_10_14_0_8_um_filter_39_9 TaxID=1974829 RepID=A0A2M7QD04_9BACT|nr:MAG: hypothetical protein COY90_02470 [Candidatus Roizmanbacteria bacterium CG_4_10_14_0_8_um_filter_39_9]